MSRAFPARAVLAALVLANPGLAHDGHGAHELAGTPGHYLLEPVHVPLVLLAAFTVAMAARTLRARAFRTRGLARVRAMDRAGSDVPATREL